MSVEVDTASAGPTAKAVRMQSAPEYIPTITGNVIVRGKPSVNNPTSDDEDSQNNPKNIWGRIKNVAQIQTEARSETSDSETPRKPVGLADFQRTAKLFIRSKQVIRKVKSRYSGNARRKFLERNSSMLSLNDIGNKLDPEMFNNYNLPDVYMNMKKKRHLKLACLQQRFLNDLPMYAEMSVKDRLLHKIQVLEKIKNEGQDDIAREKSDTDLAAPRVSKNRRQSRLRKSVDFSNSSVDLLKVIPESLKSKRKFEQNNPAIPPLTVADIDRELAVYKSRERIEDDLKLPNNRIARLTVLKSNVDKINAKFLSFKKVNKSEKGGMADDALNEEKIYYIPSRFTHSGMVSVLKKLLGLYIFYCTATRYIVMQHTSYTDSVWQHDVSCYIISLCMATRCIVF